ncbi:hypothetical protein QCA50_004396 [Cerrena zonata]|uniref:DASH complex subunit DUO1 n=1 Tax=Cerrena zonata TaxID=2478898 RepID=A0AAW0GRC6_9APHY
MDSSDFSHISLPSQDRLLSESLIFSSGSHSEPDNSNLSLSDLSLGHDQPKDKRPFSLFARPPIDESAIADDDEQHGEMDATMTQEDLENAKRQAARTREEKLQHDLFILKKLNSAFEVYKGALREAKSATDRVSIQLSHTNALLDKYTTILHNTERINRLILDERWQGAEADEAQVEAEVQAEIERRQKEEEEAAQREQERKAREERERREKEEREEKERLAREKAEKVKEKTARGMGSSGVRGVRGTRASMRAASSVRGGTSRGRGASPSGIPAPSSSISGIRRPSQSASTRGSAIGRGSRRVT